MKEFRIGADKANAVLAILSETGFPPTDPTEDPRTAATGGAGLHLVPPPAATEPTSSQQRLTLAICTAAAMP